ncbi:hypothetical protein BOX15_Mlig010035g1 [Macrostomum lignano]|uniref:Uncharacterized protein n=2 Tax=Macrostomum lignano TaxID=282301 RepID=A0A267FS41_9PLAT|nr:hypothetical protein BOX15_Mlig010035g1 [Macrostomum lignano]
MNSCVNIWQSPFLKYFTSQQHHRWFRSRAASSVIVNILAVLLIASERYWQTILWMLPSLAKYAAYHSQICLAIIVLLAWNVLNFSIRYLHCCYKLSGKFVVATEEEKLDLSRSFRGTAASSLVTVRRLASPSSPQKSPSTPPSLLLPSSSPSSPLLKSVYLPSATPAPARLQQSHRQLSSGGSGSGGKQTQMSKHHQDYRLGCAAGLLNNNRHQQQLPAAAAANRSFGGVSSSGSGDLSAYFSPPRNLSALSASLLLGGNSGPSAHHPGSPLQHPAAGQSPHLDDYSYLSRLRYQLGTPSPSNRRSSSSTGLTRNSTAPNLSPYPAESILSLMSPPTDAEPSQQQQQQVAQQQQRHWNRLSPEHTIRLLGIDRELDCTPRGLDKWLQGIRAWLHGTLIEPLSRDIERVNARLREAGASSEMLIGQASLSQLQAVINNVSANAATAAPWTRALTPLMPYLQACDDQGYLVRRLAELASLPCLGAYRWDSGSPDRWVSERHPPDARLLMSLLSAYLDRCLPPLPGNRQPFSSVFLASTSLAASGSSASVASSTPDRQQADSQLAATAGPSAGPSGSVGKTDIDSKFSTAASAGVELRIFPASRQPPHYQLLLSNQPTEQKQQLTLLDIASGSRNFFYSVLFFFYYYYSRRGGRLRQVSLGESGLNLDWIFSGRGGAAAGLDIEDLLLSSSLERDGVGSAASGKV